jgi:hypothetical protein
MLGSEDPRARQELDFAYGNIVAFIDDKPPEGIFYGALHRLAGNG